jgi:intracellular multiplication protein IcmL
MGLFGKRKKAAASDSSALATVGADEADEDEALETSASLPDQPSLAQRRIERRDYYQHTTQRLLVMLLTLLVAVIALVAVVGYMALRGPVVSNFAVTPDLRVVKMTGLEEPLVTEQGLRNWAADAVREIYSFDFVHWRDQMSSTRNLFATTQAFNAFVSAVDESGILGTVRRKKLVVSSILKEPANITASGEYKGRYSWRIEVPMRIRYESSSSARTQDLLINLVVQRVSQAENPRGLGISQIIAPRG